MQNCQTLRVFGVKVETGLRPRQPVRRALTRPMEIDMSRMKDYAYELEQTSLDAMKHSAFLLAGTHPDNEMASRALDVTLDRLREKMNDIEYRDFMFDLERIMDKYRFEW